MTTVPMSGDGEGDSGVGEGGEGGEGGASQADTNSEADFRRGGGSSDNNNNNNNNNNTSSVHDSRRSNAPATRHTVFASIGVQTDGPSAVGGGEGGEEGEGGEGGEGGGDGEGVAPATAPVPVPGHIERTFSVSGSSSPEEMMAELKQVCERGVQLLPRDLGSGRVKRRKGAGV